MFLNCFRVVLVAALICLSAILAFPRPLIASGDLLCSTFPIYLFTKNITEGRDVFKTDLLVSGAQGCPHDYAPTPAELERLSQANVLIINGLGLEGFLSQALKVAKPGLRIVDASGQGLSLDSRLPTGGQLAISSSAEAGLDMGSPPDLFLTRDDLIGKSRLHHHDGPNPHLFAAPGSAVMQIGRIAEALAALDPAGAEVYRANAARLIDDLRRIANSFAAAGRELGNPKVIVSHGVFDFLAQDMGLHIVASIEEEDGADPSAARLAELVAVAKEQEVKAILVDPQGNINMARALGAETKIPVAVIDTVASGPADAPLEYYQGVMLTDLDVLVKLFTAPPKSASGKTGKK
ncbi:ABC transporter substrate-binding protein [Deltaproteobacteria bacterium Smac51]|nr:ABC transporter substrate-binding protein [Deltaproteobacteria bacterium Smac51]